MTWQNEMSIILRHLVNDLDSSSYTFSDDRIEETILVASQLVLHEADFENTYTVDVDASSLSPDPTSASNKDDAFISLICLKSAYILLGSELKTHSLNAISLKDGPSALVLWGIVQGLNILFTDIAKRYDEAKIQYQLGGSIAGQAVLSPYSPGSDGVSGSARSGRFE